MHSVHLIERFLLVSLDKISLRGLSVQTCGICKDIFCVLWSLCGGWKDWPSVTPSLVLSQQQQAFDGGGRGQWSHLFLTASALLLTLSLSLSILTISPLIPSTQPGRVYQMTQAMNFSFLSHLSQPAKPECVRPCFCVCMCVCMHLISSSLAVRTWWVC